MLNLLMEAVKRNISTQFFVQNCLKFRDMMIALWNQFNISAMRTRKNPKMSITKKLKSEISNRNE